MEHTDIIVPPNWWDIVENLEAVKKLSTAEMATRKAIFGCAEYLRRYQDSQVQQQLFVLEQGLRDFLRNTEDIRLIGRSYKGIFYKE